MADWAYVVGAVLSGMVRGLLAALIVLALGLAFRVPIAMTPTLCWEAYCSPPLFLPPLPSAAAMLAKSHADQGMLSSSDELSRIMLVDVVLRTRDGVEIRKRCVAQPTPLQAELLQRLKFPLPRHLAVTRENVVTPNGPENDS